MLSNVFSCEILLTELSSKKQKRMKGFIKSIRMVEKIFNGLLEIMFTFDER